MSTTLLPRPSHRRPQPARVLPRHRARGAHAPAGRRRRPHRALRGEPAHHVRALRGAVRADGRRAAAQAAGDDAGRGRQRADRASSAAVRCSGSAMSRCSWRAFCRTASHASWWTSTTTSRWAAAPTARWPTLRARRPWPCARRRVRRAGCEVPAAGGRAQRRERDVVAQHRPRRAAAVRDVAAGRAARAPTRCCASWASIRRSCRSAARRTDAPCCCASCRDCSPGCTTPRPSTMCTIS